LAQLEQFHVGFNEITSQQQRLGRRWLQLGVLSLGLAGLFAILLVLSRTPGSENFFPWIDFFHTALVVHVDQSVLIWFLSMSGLVWSLAMPSGRSLLIWQWLAFVMALLGTLGIALSAFVGEGAPLMNNYVPVLQRPIFFLMLGIFAVGIGLQALLALSLLPRCLNLTRPLSLRELAALTVSLAVIMALIAILTAWLQIPDGVAGQGLFEYLFWGGGHTLQFAYTQLIMLVWLLLALSSGVAIPAFHRGFVGLFLLGFAPVLTVPFIYAIYETVNLASREAFTHLMRYGGGLAVIPLGAVVVWALLRSSPAAGVQKPLRRSLWMSLLLFFAGGLISLFISGVNTIIPAHYHGSIVGVTLALMGLAYLIMPRLGYAPVTGRLAELQPWIYGFGQLIHITALAISGAMGIQRKTAGAAQGLDTLAAKATMGVMGLGGLLAVIGGIIFVWVMLKAFLKGDQGERETA
jgi:cytochrome c oxidase subunit I